ncbi:MAG TPA: hypothetical protein VHG51_10720 [Longimicrobiaceae bacterium]|nr:hypothetical protein [Longimicrobiaceae bacterium]
MEVHGSEARLTAIVGSWLDLRIRFSGGEPTAATWSIGPEKGQLERITRVR